MNPAGDRSYRVDCFELLPTVRSIRVAGAPRSLRPKTFDILVYLVENRHRIVTKDELIQAVWPDVAVTDDSLVQCIAELRRLLGDEARKPRFIRTVLKLGYQFVGPVSEVLPPQAPGGLLIGTMELEEVTTVQVEMTDDRAPGLLSGPGRSVRHAWVAAGALFLLVGFLLVWRLSNHPQPETTLPQVAGKSSVVVLRFDNQSRTPELDWLGEGLADMVIADFSRSAQINVLSRQQVTNLVARPGSNLKDPLRLEDALGIAKRARARILLLGSFAKLGDKIRVNIQIHRPDGSFLKTETATALDPGQLIGEMGVLSAKLMRDIGAPAPKHRDPSPLPVTSNLEAYRSYSLGVERLTAMEVPEGIQLLEHAVALDPQFAVAYAALGNAYTINWGRPPLGKPYYEKAFQYSNRLTDKDRLYISAGYALANSDYIEAIQAFRRIVSAYPDDALAYRRLAGLLEGEARYQEALAAIQQGLAADPDEPSLYNFILPYCHLGRCEDGVVSTERFVQLSGGESNSYDSAGMAYAWVGRYADADKAYAEAIARKPDFFIPRMHAAILHYWQGRYSRAISECEQLIPLSPSANEKGRARECVAWIYYRRGDTRKSQNELAKFPRESSDAAAIMALDRGDLASADKFVNFASDVSGRGKRVSPRYLFWFLGQRALAKGENEEAIARFRELLVKPEPIGSMEWFEDSLGDAFLRLGRCDAAIDEYRRILSVNPNHAMARYHLAVAYAQKRDTAHSRDEYRKFLDTWKDADPDIPEVRAARAAVQTKH